MQIGKSGTFNIAGDGGFTLRVDWSETYDVNTNTSKVFINALSVQSTIYGGKWFFGGTVQVDGQNIQTLSYYEPATHAVQVTAAGDRWYSVYATAAGASFPWVSGDIVHEPDGSKKVTFDFNLTLYRNSSSPYPVIIGSAEVELTEIPYASDLTVSNGTLGVAQNLTITKKAEKYTHTITYACGTASGTICAKSGDTSINWTPPLSLASQNTHGTSVAVQFEITTFNGDVVLGTKAVSITCDIPESVKPSFAVAVSDAMGYANNFGGYVQTKSKLNIVVDITTMYDASVASVKITANGETHNESNITTGALKNSGNNTITVEVIDSRGRKVSGNKTVAVLAYSAPAISLLTYNRCDSDGTDNALGNYAEITFANAVTSLSGKNAVNYKLEYKKTSDSEYSTANMNAFAGKYSVTNGTVIIAADSGSSYDVRLTVSDSFDFDDETLLIETGFAIMHWLPKGVGMAIGKIAEKLNTLELGWKIHMNGNRIAGLADPQAQEDAVNKRYLESRLSDIGGGGASGSGADGYSPSATVEQTVYGATITITDKYGTTEANITNGKTPVKGTDYWTNADKAELVEEVKKSDVVMYTEQNYPEKKKAQARFNIGAVSMEEVEELLGIEEEFSVTGEVVEFDVDVEPGTDLQVISKIHRDETWGLSDKLVLHQVSGTNFVDFTSYLGGVGTVFEKNGLTATVNDDSTVTIRGTNESSSSVNIIDKYGWSGEQVYPAGTYAIPSGFIMAIRAAQYPANVKIEGYGNLKNKVTFTEPFRIVWLSYSVKTGTTVDITLPLGLFIGNSVPETGCEYSGNIYTATFDAPIYEGEFNWSTGELKDADGNTVGYYDVPEIKRLPGTNYFWTCFGENTVSNASNDLGKIGLRLNEIAPEDTIPSICDFMLKPSTPQAAYCLHATNIIAGGEFNGHEIPLVTTKGTLSVVDSNGAVTTEKYVDALINWRGVSDVLTNKGIHKAWGDKFYFTKEPVSQEDFSDVNNALYTFEFTEDDFRNTGIPAKLDDIPIVSPCFYTGSDAASKLTQRVWGGGVFPATFSWDGIASKYVFKVRGLYPGYIMKQLQNFTKGYFHYQLETPYDVATTFAMGISSGDTVTFTVDDSDWKMYFDGGLFHSSSSADVTPSVYAYVARNAEDACDGMLNVARMLNNSGKAGGDATVQGYSWIGEGDGATDYTTQIQSKLDELHTVSNGGTIHLGPGTYPISKSLIVYRNTQIVGDGRTVIDQKSDNTHAVIWNGSDIHMSDLTIKLSGECTELTACIFANSNNTGENRDERYPENTYVWNCSTRNVTLMGTYSISWEDGYAYLSDRAMAYRGVGILQYKLFFNYYDSGNLICKHLYAGVYNGGGANNFCLYVTGSRFAFYGGGRNNILDIHGHTYYDHHGRDGTVLGTEYVSYCEHGMGNTITTGFYDPQYSKGLLYFDATSTMNRYAIPSSTTGVFNSSGSHDAFRRVDDYGRGNAEIQPIKENYVGIGSDLRCISGLPYWNTQFNPSIHNALSGAGVWGSVTSNKEWTSNGLNLSGICRYPEETAKATTGLASTICNESPSEDSPVEIVIDISDRPAANYNGFWIQFDHRYVAADYTVSFDTTNDGTFDHVAVTVVGNNQPVSCRLDYQAIPRMVYRIKISITKALQIQDFKYMDAADNAYIIDYNPDGLVGIVNIGMPSNEAYGRAFLGECGGSLYGNVDMHQNTLKNLPDPVDAGDAVSKSYLEERLAALEALISGK